MLIDFINWHSCTFRQFIAEIISKTTALDTIVQANKISHGVLGKRACISSRAWKSVANFVYLFFTQKPAKFVHTSGVKKQNC